MRSQSNHPQSFGLRPFAPGEREAPRVAARTGAPALAYSLVIAAFLYLTLAIGKVATPATFLEQPAYWNSLAFALAFLLILVKPVPLKAMGKGFLFLLPYLAVLAISSLMTEDWAYALKKLDSAFLVTLLAAAVTAELVARNGEPGAVKLFLLVSLAMLGLTVLYKLQMGFFDRQSRFFLNGPIVFGWLMGFSALLAMHAYLNEKRALFWLCAAMAFALAVLWTASKGPLIALAITGLLMLASRLSWRAVLMLAALPSLAYVLAQEILPEGALERLSAIGRFFSGQTTGADAGSIDARSGALSDAFGMFRDNPLFGVGLGNFQFNSATGFIYPHNIMLEALAEMGLAGALALLFVFARVLMATSRLGRLVLIYFLVALSFSGDLSYLHLILGVPLALIGPRQTAWRGPL